nr:molybdenum cofactor biosynthesis protein [Melanopsichium pennsylvanicum 4]
MISGARKYHTSSKRINRTKEEEEEEEEDDDNPWGDLDKAFENLQDKSLYKQVYLNHHSSANPNPTTTSSPSSSSSPTHSAPIRPVDPIAAMEEAIFAQAGAAAVKATLKTSRNAKMMPIAGGGVKFSDLPPNPLGMGLYNGPTGTGMDDPRQGMVMEGTLNGANLADGVQGAKWSKHMQGRREEDDGPWSSLDAFVDNPEASAEFAVRLHMQPQHQVWEQSAQMHSHNAPQHRHHQHQQPQQYPRTTSQPFTFNEALAANTDLLNQQTQLSSEEEMFAQAGAAAVADMSPCQPASSSSPIGITCSIGNIGAHDEGLRLTHIDAQRGGASMVDVSPKPTTHRSATAVGRIFLPSSAAELIRNTDSTSSGVSGKGPVLHTAQLAGIMAAKRTADLIPLCHPLPLTHVQVNLNIMDNGEGGESYINVECTARTAGQTGVEMEALTGCTVACLTVWDMVKAVAGKQMRIGHIMVIKKMGGKSGDWQR